MNQITQTGATSEIAVSEALSKLGVTKEQASVEVLQESKKGFLGFGSKEAIVKVTVLNIESQTDVINDANKDVEKSERKQEKVVHIYENEDIMALSLNDDKEEHTVEDKQIAVLETEKYIYAIAKEMKIDDLKITTTLNGKYVQLQLESKKAAMLIGKRGQTLNSIQQLAQFVINKYAKQYLVVRIDVENYRERRQESLEQLAQRMADKAMRTRKRVELEPMPSHERKVIHDILSSNLNIETFSEGTEPNRHIVIEPVK